MSDSPKIIEKLKEREKYSPDYHSFRSFEYVALFVYDEFKREGDLFDVISEDLIFLGQGRTASDQYCLKKYGDKPVLFSERDNPLRKGYIDGQIFAVRPEAILKMDILHKNGEMFNRHKRHFLMRDQKSPLKVNAKPYLDCYYYAGNEEFFDPGHNIFETSFHVNTTTNTRNKVYFYSTKSVSSSVNQNNDMFNGMWH